MGVLKNSAIGHLSGRAGQLTFYSRGGKNYFAHRPESYIIKSDKVIKNNNTFSWRNKFTSPIYKDKLIQDVWTAAAPDKGDRYRLLVSKNSRLIVNDRPSRWNVITPEGEANPIDSITYNSGKLSVKLLLQVEGTLVAYLVPMNPVNPEHPFFQVFKAPNTLITAQVFEIEMHPAHKNIALNYSDYIIYAAVINGEGKKIKWTTTFASEGKF